MKKFGAWKVITIIIAALVLGFFDLPGETQKTIIPFTPDSISNNKIYLGLDLQGGSQLEYKIDLRKVPESDQEAIVEGVRGVIEKRVNGLGVAEPSIYVSDVGGETHIIVELAETATISQEDVDTYLAGGVVSELSEDDKKLVSLEKAKATVGKTIQLEFKEEKDSIDPQEKDKIEANAIAALTKINNGSDFSIVGQEEMQGFPGKVEYEKTQFVFEDKITASAVRETISTLEPGEYTSELIETGDEWIFDDSGNAIQKTGLSIIKLLETKETIKNAKEVDTRHILLSWTGLDSADASITRTKEEAYDLAKEIKQKIADGETFETLAQENSDDKSNAADGGKLSAPVTDDNTYAFEFQKASLDFTEAGEMSEIIETNFGYHLIKADDVRTDVSYPQYQYEIITYSTVPDTWKDTGLTGKHFVHADVQLDQFYQPYVQIQFNDEGAALFEEITSRIIGEKLAIFVGGQQISAPRVNETIAGGSAQISGQFTNEEAKTLARDLNTGAIPAPIILTGEYTIGATLGHEALTTSMTAGLIGLVLIMLFMLAYYRAAGIVANVALFIYAAILLFLIKSQLPLGLALLIALAIFMFLIVKIVNNKDSGWEKFISFVLSCLAFFFMTYLLKTGVVLTLAGVAGIILSIGMAVDANILIFERFKEELRSGKSFSAAVDTGFARAWSAIRDSNFSTLLTCAILFMLGSSVIKGFAFNLAAGILVSMFTAITITRVLLRSYVGKKISKNPKAFGINLERKGFNFKIIQNTKIWLTLSSIFVGIGIISIFSFGLNLGIDFTGGTLLEFKFSEPVTKVELSDSLLEIEGEIKGGNLIQVEEEVVVAEPEATEEDAAISENLIVEDGETNINEPVIEGDDSVALDLSGMKLIESGENTMIVKTKYLTSATHDQLVNKMKERLPEFTEPRFTTIGPVIGQSLFKKAVTAIIFALIMIVVYIGFAFRKVPKEVSPWRFGACAIAALLHDIIIVTGIFAIIGYFMDVEIDILFITAMLTVFGYSVNDTIVIFDRIRENLIKHEKDETVSAIANKSLNETLARSMNTSFSTLLALVSILILGSSSIFFFILALTLGTIAGTYSSIFMASPMLVMWNNWAAKKNKNELK